MMKYLNVTCAATGIAALLALRHLDLSRGAASIACVGVIVGVVGTVGTLLLRLLYASNLRLANHHEAGRKAMVQVESAFWPFFIGLTIAFLDAARDPFLAGDHRNAVLVGLVPPFVALGSYVGLIRTQITK